MGRKGRARNRNCSFPSGEGAERSEAEGVTPFRACTRDPLRPLAYGSQPPPPDGEEWMGRNGWGGIDGEERKKGERLPTVGTRRSDPFDPGGEPVGLAFEVEHAVLEAGRVDVGGLGDLGAHGQLAARGRRAEPCGRIRHVAEDGEVE